MHRVYFTWPFFFLSIHISYTKDQEIKLIQMHIRSDLRGGNIEQKNCRLCCQAVQNLRDQNFVCPLCVSGWTLFQKFPITALSLSMFSILIVDVLLKAVGDTPIMKTKKWAVDRGRTLQSLSQFISRFLKLDANEQLVRMKFVHYLFLFLQIMTWAVIYFFRSLCLTASAFVFFSPVHLC